MPSHLRIGVRFLYLLLIVICIIGFGIRWLQISGDLYSDEIWVITTAVSPFSDFLAEVTEDWVHPPLFHFIVRGWIFFFGYDDLSGRLVAVTFGVLSIPLIFLLGKQISGIRAGLLASALIALSPIHIYHSQYGRHYSLFVFLVLLSMIAFLRLYYRPDNRRYLFFYLLANILLVYTHYFGWLVVLCQGLFFVFRHFKYIRRWAFLEAIILLSYLPWLLVIAKYTAASASSGNVIPQVVWINEPSILEPLKTLAIFNGQLSSPHQGKIGLVLLGTIALFPIKGVINNDKYRGVILFLLSCLVLPFTLVFIFSHTIQPIWVLRGMLLSLPAYYLLLALGSEQIAERASFAFLLIPVAWMTLACSFYLQSYHRMPFEQISSYLKNNSGSDVPIFVENTYLMNPIFFYYEGNGLLYELRESNVSIVPASHKCGYSEIGGKGNRFILLTYTPEGENIQSEIPSIYELVGQREFLGYGEEGQRRRVTVSIYKKNTGIRFNKNNGFIR